MNKDIERIFFSEEDIKKRIVEVGAQITADYKDKQEDGIVVMSILKGAAVFMTDLIRAIDLDMEIDFMDCSSYYNSTESNGRPRIEKDMTCEIAGKHVIIAEDVVDSGITLDYLLKHFESRNPASVEIVAFLHKHIEKVDLDVKYQCFDCPKDFIVGYGLDYAQKYRNLPYVGVLKPEIYEKN